MFYSCDVCDTEVYSSMMSDNRIRPARVIGKYRLSVQASNFHYCTPRVDGLPFEDYTHYEIAILDDIGIIDPSNILSPELYGRLWNGATVAGWVSKEDVDKVYRELVELPE